MEENELIALSKEGNHEAFEELIKLYEKQIYNIAYRIAMNSHDAMDISQDSLIKIYNNIKYFEERSRFSTWIFRIVTNSAIDFVKKHRKIKFVPIEENTQSFETVDEMFEKNESIRKIYNALEKLDVNQRAIIVLKDIYGFSYDEISKILVINQGTVKSRLNRARKALKNKISKEEQNG